MDAKLAETLAALERGERPPCPWCGETKLTHVSKAYKGVVDYLWACDTEMSRDDVETVSYARGEVCVNRTDKDELAALREENARLSEALSCAKNTLKVVVDHIDTKIYPDLADRMVEAWDRCEDVLNKERDA